MTFNNMEVWTGINLVRRVGDVHTNQRNVETLASMGLDLLSCQVVQVVLLLQMDLVVPENKQASKTADSR